jgi:hypothetical protein
MPTPAISDFRGKSIFEPAELLKNHGTWLVEGQFLMLRIQPDISYATSQASIRSTNRLTSIQGGTVLKVELSGKKLLGLCAMPHGILQGTIRDGLSIIIHLPLSRTVFPGLAGENSCPVNQRRFEKRIDSNGSVPCLGLGMDLPQFVNSLPK